MNFPLVVKCTVLLHCKDKNFTVEVEVAGAYKVLVYKSCVELSLVMQCKTWNFGATQSHNFKKLKICKIKQQIQLFQYIYSTIFVDFFNLKFLN